MSDLVQFIQDGGFEVKLATTLLGIARSTFYSLVSDTPSQRRIETQAITQAIDQLYHDANLVIEALDNATLNRQIKGQRLIVHTDLGSQYTGFAFENKLHELGLIHSYSRKGTPYDNAGIESFHATLKKEEVYVSSYQTAK